MARARFRRLGGLRVRFAALGDVVDDEEEDGHGDGARQACWPRRCGGALRRSSRVSTNRARETRRELVERGNGSGRERGVSRREKGARGGLEGARRRRGVHGWLGGIPPSSLEARGGEEDSAAPLGRVGWMGRLRLGV